MRITQGTFSFLPVLTDDEIRAQVDYALSKGWGLSVEYTDDPHPRNMYWEMWGLPMFTVKDGAAVVFEVNACRKTYPNYYIKANAFDNTRGVESMCLSFIVNRPKNEPGFGQIFFFHCTGCCDLSYGFAAGSSTGARKPVCPRKYKNPGEIARILPVNSSRGVGSIHNEAWSLRSQRISWI